MTLKELEEKLSRATEDGVCATCKNLPGDSVTGERFCPDCETGTTPTYLDVLLECVDGVPCPLKTVPHKDDGEECTGYEIEPSPRTLDELIHKLRGKNNES